MNVRSFLEALLGAARGAAAGSGCAARGYEQAQAQCSANYQRLLGQEAARFEAQHEALMGGTKRPRWQDISTISTSTCTPTTTSWPADLNRPAVVVQQASPAKVPAIEGITETDRHPGGYRPVELEAHEDFAVKLAARGITWDHHTESSKK